MRARVASSWQLLPGHFQPSIHPFTLGYPKFDGQVVAHAYHYVCPAGEARVIQLVPNGGYPPWFGIVNNAPPGTWLDNNPNSTTYMRLFIPAQSIGSWSIDITLFGQAGNPINPVWTYNAVSPSDTSVFVWMAGGAGGSENGTPANPLRGLGNLLGTTQASNTWQGRQAIVSGTHNISGHASGLYDTNGTRLVLLVSKPQVWVAAAGGATWRGSTSNANGANFNPSQAVGNFTMVGFNWQNPFMDESGGGGTQERNCYVHGSASAFSRGIFCFNDFDGTAPAPDTGSNSGALFYAGGSESFGTIAANTFRNMNNVFPVQYYDALDQYIFCNDYRDSTNTVGFYVKGGNVQRRFSFWGNRALTNITNVLAHIDSIQPDPPWDRLEMEFMHNRSKCVTMVSLTGAMADSDYDVHCVRNSFKGTQMIRCQGIEAGDTVRSEYNLIEHSAGTQGITVTGGSTVVPTSQNNIAGASGILDDNTLIQDGGTNGTHGAPFA